MQSEWRIGILGFGPVGRSFAEILSEKGDWLEKTYGTRLHIVAAVDRTGGAIDNTGLDPARLVEAKRKGSVAERSNCEQLELFALGEVE